MEMKKVKIFLENQFKYEGELISKDDTTIKIIDSKTQNPVEIRLDKVLSIEEIE